jgi:hypothetical protein
MGILGISLGKYLRELKGMYSVEFPTQLLVEMVDLIETCNAKSPKRALLVVSDEEELIDKDKIHWSEILGWRTNDDRIFAWERGIKEPDTSFTSAVKPFISRRFPGNPSGECTLKLFAQLTIKELFTKHKIPTTGDTYDAFCETAWWVLGVLRFSFENAGSVLGNHWSDDFLIHWSETLNLLNSQVGELVIAHKVLDARHAWDIVRLSGLPVPQKLMNMGNPFIVRPSILEEHYWPELAKKWQIIVDDHLKIEEERASFLTILDKNTLGAGLQSSWRGLDWSQLNTELNVDNIAAPMVGQKVFSSNLSPSLMFSQPLYPVAQKPSWWGITEKEIDDAIETSNNTTTLTLVEGNDTLVNVDGQKSTYLLNLRQGTITESSHKKGWAAQVLIKNIELELKAIWKKLELSYLPVDKSKNGYTWVNPDQISIEIGSGIKVEAIETRKISSALGDKLVIKFDLLISYEAREQKDDGSVSGKWILARNLKLKLHVDDVLEDSKTETRTIEPICKILVPSPFFPCVFIFPAKGKLYLSPDSKNNFSYIGDEKWKPDQTPDIILQEEGRYWVWLYDGTILPGSFEFSPIGEAFANDCVLKPSTMPGLHKSENEILIDDGDVVKVNDSEIATIKVKQRSDSLSSGLLSVVRGLPAGQKSPSELAKESVLGKYQYGIVKKLCDCKINKVNSLFQYILITGNESIEWKHHLGKPNPQFLQDDIGALYLPEIGEGPSNLLIQNGAWQNFMDAICALSESIGLKPGEEKTWLSGIDPSVVPLKTLQDYISAHIDLIKAAKNISIKDSFWACYPFSIIVVDGKDGASYGKLQSIFLSPLHPVRLAWAYSVATIAKNTRSLVSEKLIGLAEGWNFPLTGFAPGISELPLELVAVPIDPGSEQDFVAWGGLCVLRDGIVQLPRLASGMVLPWAGQTGINREVVKQAIQDYLAVHPHINALEIDIRSVLESPRSREIDQAVLDLLGGTSILSGVNFLTGGIRVQDSISRQGIGPTRDQLSILREDGNSNKQFEWIRYAPSNKPLNADIAFIENSSVHLGVTNGKANGIIGRLPFRRFSPSILDKNRLLQDYSSLNGEDLLGLASLLNEIENYDSTQLKSLEAIPQPRALGIGSGAKWEILGALNIDPSILSSVIAKHFEDDKRMLWEWRPSWLSISKNADIAKRPYYVVGKIPHSLLKALEFRQGLSSQHSFEMLSDLGRRGIGLASLHASGGTQESAAAGLFYAMRLLLPPELHNLPAAWPNTVGDQVICSILPLDPIQSMLEDLAGEKFERRADLILVLASKKDFTRICLIPIEVKHHGSDSSPEPLPTDADDELKRAKDQLEKTHKLFLAIIRQLSTIGEGNELVNYIKQIGLAVLIELALDLSPMPIDTQRQSEILYDVINGNFSIKSEKSLLLWFAPGSISTSGTACVIKEGEVINQVFIDPSAAKGLWWDDTSTGPDDEKTRKSVDELMVEITKSCECSEIINPGIKSWSKIVVDNLHDMSSKEIKVEHPDSEKKQAEAKLADEIHKPDQPQGQDGINNDKKYIVETAAGVEPSPQKNLELPRAFLGWSSPTTRWSVIGQLPGSNEFVGMDLDNPKALGIFGYMGSGKSYLLSTLVESAVQPIPNINALSAPLGVVIFNYRRNATDRFELSSLTFPNDDPKDLARLEQYNATPQSIKDIQIMCLPGELTRERLVEYENLPAAELIFNPSTLTVEDWELLMGEPGSNAVFARTIRHALRELRSHVTLESLEDYVLGMLKGQSKTAAELRFDFIRQYISEDKGVDFNNLVKPGRVVILDLRQPLFNKEDALRFFLICSNYISRVQGRFNKIVVFDEAHEYLSEEFGEKLDARIRLMRHEGTTYIFATQDVGSIPSAIRRFLTTRFVFSLGTRENIDDLLKIAPEFDGYDLQQMQPGQCLVQSTESINNIFRKPRIVQIRPRVTRHGGTSRIFTKDNTKD